MSGENVFEQIDKVDQYIYHYTSLQKGLEYILPTMKLRLSPLKHTNDPRESKHLVLSIPDIDNYIEGKDEETLDAATDTTKFLKLLQREHKVVCFSRDSEEYFNVPDKFKTIYRGYNKPTLWAHYADNHRGMCFIFDKSKLMKSVSSEFSDAKYKIYKENIVQYDALENIIDKFSVKFENYLKLGAKKWLQDYFNKNYTTLLLSKTSDWKTENEFRIIIKCKQKTDFLFLPINDSLSGIVLGADFPFAYHKLIQSYKVPCGVIGWFSGIPYIRFRLV